ncbi:hypothetical protein RRG08_038020 [Elysia crispata]|uniref:Uncharacterized protein n=1 Tax=Elysia crispata TaxID=231223 RepID=A0AAE0ZY81_9GAST|nr:hypothetical protein RRG08_038020 [Elysia crispata]
MDVPRGYRMHARYPYEQEAEIVGMSCCQRATHTCWDLIQACPLGKESIWSLMESFSDGRSQVLLRLTSRPAPHDMRQHERACSAKITACEFMCVSCSYTPVGSRWSVLLTAVMDRSIGGCTCFSGIKCGWFMSRFGSLSKSARHKRAAHQSKLDCCSTQSCRYLLREIDQ